MAKLSFVKFANAVRIGPKTEVYIDEKHYDIELEGILIKMWMKGKRGIEIPDESSVMNAIFFKRAKLPELEKSEDLADVTPAPIARGGKKKSVSQVA